MLKFSTFFYFLFLFLSLFFNPLTKSCIDIFKILNPQYHEVGKNELYKHLDNPIINQTVKNKNIVYIYLESFSRNFTINYDNLTPNLNSLSNKIEFININQISNGANITIEGLYASQCGLPFSIIPFGKKTDNKVNLVNAKPDFKSSNIVCATDILKENGYYAYFIKGASLGFQNTNKFLEARNYDEFYGKDELLKRGAQNLNEWGVDDDEMFDIAYKDFIRLSETKDKFLQVILNVNMHVPDGFIPKQCSNIKYKNGSKKMLNAVKCTDYLVGKFINKILTSKYSRDTIIVIQSDHLMPYLSANGVSKSDMNDSKLYFTIVDQDIKKDIIVDTHGSSLDTFTTLLGYLEITDKMNLGRNILKEKSLNNTVSNIDFIYKVAIGSRGKLKYKKNK